MMDVQFASLVSPAKLDKIFVSIQYSRVSGHLNQFSYCHVMDGKQTNLSHGYARDLAGAWLHLENLSFWIISPPTSI